MAALRAVADGTRPRELVLDAYLLRAMGIAVLKLNPPPQLVLVDGMQTPDLSLPAEAIVKGDATSASIPAASILAKVFRDRIMIAWDRRFPGYGFVPSLFCCAVGCGDPALC